MMRKLWFCSLGLVLALAAAPAMAQFVATFDTDAEGFVAAFGNNQQGDFLVEGDGAGNLRVTYGENEVYDPQVSAGGGLSIDADANPEFAVKFSASGLNQEYNCGVFTFSSAGHARNTFVYNNGDDQVKRINFATNTGDNVEDTINPNNFNGQTLTNFRMDFPEQNVGWADADAVILIDWLPGRTTRTSSHRAPRARARVKGSIRGTRWMRRWWGRPRYRTVRSARVSTAGPRR